MEVKKRGRGAMSVTTATTASDVTGCRAPLGFQHEGYEVMYAAATDGAAEDDDPVLIDGPPPAEDGEVATTRMVRGVLVPLLGHAWCVTARRADLVRGKVPAAGE